MATQAPHIEAPLSPANSVCPIAVSDADTALIHDAILHWMTTLNRQGGELRNLGMASVANELHARYNAANKALERLESGTLWISPRTEGGAK